MVGLLSTRGHRSVPPVGANDVAGLYGRPNGYPQGDREVTVAVVPQPPVAVMNLTAQNAYQLSLGADADGSAELLEHAEDSPRGDLDLLRSRRERHYLVTLTGGGYGWTMRMTSSLAPPILLCGTPLRPRLICQAVQWWIYCTPLMI